MANNRAVTATALGEWPGTDPFEAARTIRGELGAPHLPHLASLPHRGPGSDAVGRTAAALVDLPVDHQLHGWRLVARPGQDHRRAVSALSTDINVLGDVIGAESVPNAEIKVHLRGPLSLAANLHLHSGERALLDPGARREIYESLAAGAAALLRRVAEAAGNAPVHLQLDEPDVGLVLAGAIPTSSGYRTLRAVPAREVAGAWDLIRDATQGTGGELVIALPAEDNALEAFALSSADGAALRVGALTAGLWEQIAGFLEGDRALWAGVLDPAGGQLPEVSRLVQALTRPWRGLGLPYHRLGQVRVTPTAGLAEVDPARAQSILHRLTQTADALNEVVADA